MRISVHLLLFAAAITVAVGVLGPLVGSIDARNIQFADLRNGFTPGRTLDDIAAHTTPFRTSLAVGFLGVAAVMLIAALIGSHILGLLAVAAGFAGLGLLTWRLDQLVHHQLRTDYRHLLNGAWGLYLIGGALMIALLMVITPADRGFMVMTPIDRRMTMTPAERRRRRW